MIDRTSKFLLTVIALLLLALLVHPMLAPIPAQAQTNNALTPAPALMVAENGTVYILQNGKLSAYIVETPTTRKTLSQLGLGGNEPVTLRHLATVNVNKP